jgi:hypothetical protein
MYKVCILTKKDHMKAIYATEDIGIQYWQYLVYFNLDNLHRK